MPRAALAQAELGCGCLSMLGLALHLACRTARPGRRHAADSHPQAVRACGLQWVFGVEQDKDAFTAYSRNLYEDCYREQPGSVAFRPQPLAEVRRPHVQFGMPLLALSMTCALRVAASDGCTTRR